MTVMRLLRIVTLSALTVTVPVMSFPSITVPGVVTVIDPEAVRVVPAGTPTLPAFGSGYPQAPGLGKHADVGGAGRGRGGGAGVVPFETVSVFEPAATFALLPQPEVIATSTAIAPIMSAVP
ncbi:MAG TPA: hypothetical protein VF232_03345 [Gaiellaceae bacterium]